MQRYIITYVYHHIYTSDIQKIHFDAVLPLLNCLHIDGGIIPRCWTEAVRRGHNGCNTEVFPHFSVLMLNVQEYTLSEYLRMSGIYWGLTVMDLMGQLPRMNRQEIIDFIKSCQHDCGGISASIGHDPHLLYTLSAVQVNPKTSSWSHLSCCRVDRCS